jgi:hypothetical protein
VERRGRRPLDREAGRGSGAAGRCPPECVPSDEGLVDRFTSPTPCYPSLSRATRSGDLNAVRIVLVPPETVLHGAVTDQAGTEFLGT